MKNFPLYISEKLKVSAKQKHLDDPNNFCVWFGINNQDDIDVLNDLKSGKNVLSLELDELEQKYKKETGKILFVCEPYELVLMSAVISAYLFQNDGQNINWVRVSRKLINYSWFEAFHSDHTVVSFFSSNCYDPLDVVYVLVNNYRDEFMELVDMCRKYPKMHAKISEELVFSYNGCEGAYDEFLNTFKDTEDYKEIEEYDKKL